MAVSEIDEINLKLKEIQDPITKLERDLEILKEISQKDIDKLNVKLAFLNRKEKYSSYITQDKPVLIQKDYAQEMIDICVKSNIKFDMRDYIVRAKTYSALQKLLKYSPDPDSWGEFDDFKMVLSKGILCDDCRENCCYGPHVYDAHVYGERVKTSDDSDSTDDSNSSEEVICTRDVFVNIYSKYKDPNIHYIKIDHKTTIFKCDWLKNWDEYFPCCDIDYEDVFQGDPYDEGMCYQGFAYVECVMFIFVDE